MKSQRKLTAAEVGEALRPMFQDKEYWVMFVSLEDGREKNMCFECGERRAGQLDAIRKMPRGRTLPCDFCGKKIEETKILPSVH